MPRTPAGGRPLYGRPVDAFDQLLGIYCPGLRFYLRVPPYLYLGSKFQAPEQSFFGVNQGRSFARFRNLGTGEGWRPIVDHDFWGSSDGTHRDVQRADYARRSSSLRSSNESF